MADRCSVIDKPTANRVPRLKIVFGSDDSRDSVLRSGKHLRDSTDTAVRAIYLNPDLTPAEAKAAYDERVRRRQSRSSQQPAADDTPQGSGSTSTGNSLLRPTAPEFARP